VVKVLRVKLRGRGELVFDHHPGIVGAVAFAHVLSGWWSGRR
jgi:hypothetical protein